MNDESKRSDDQPHKKGADSHDPAKKHDKVSGGHKTSRDIREDRGVRQNKLGKHKN